MQWRKNSIYLFIYFYNFETQASDPLLLFSLVNAGNSHASLRKALAFPFSSFVQVFLFGLKFFFLPSLSLSLSLCFLKSSSSSMTSDCSHITKLSLSSSLKTPMVLTLLLRAGSFAENVCLSWLCYIKQEAKISFYYLCVPPKLLMPSTSQFINSYKMKEGEEENSTGNWDTQS